MVNLTTPGGARAVARCDALGASPYSDMEGGLFRAYLTPAYRAAQEMLAGWMRDAGMIVRVDPAANLIGRYEGTAPDAPVLLIGSHLDSVRDGGRYDGPLGIMLGIECVDALHRAATHMAFAIEIIAFGDEEGSRFPAAMLTSRAVAGTLQSGALDLSDDQGITLADALRHYHEGNSSTFTRLSDFLKARLDAPVAYLEAHIEQGPTLENEGLAVGAVTGIAAQLRYQASIRGVAGHAGTSSMTLRRDALAGAAEMILMIERVAREDASDLVATVGRIIAGPGAPNVIPGRADFTLDIRSGDAVRRDRAAATMLERIERIARARGLECDVRLIHDLPASPCDPLLTDMIDAAIGDARQPRRRLVSGAGHDAMVMAALCPTAMLFIRCRDGVSHNPAEHVDPADADIALQVMAGFLDRLGTQFASA